MDINKEFFRPGETNDAILKGSHNSIKKDLGWEPQLEWRDLAEEMLDYDLRIL